MNPVDQAFMNAYAKKRPVQPSPTAAPSTASRPLPDPSGMKVRRADTPIQPAQPAQPHFQPNLDPPTLAASQRSPSIVVPFQSPATRSAIETQTQFRLRIDRAQNSPAVPTPKIRITPTPSGDAYPVQEPIAPAPSTTQRRTLTSYLHQARQAPSATVGPTAHQAEASKDATGKSTALHSGRIQSNPIPSEAKSPTVATRWSTPINAAMNAFRVDPRHDKYPAANRPEELVPWSSQLVERGTKAVSESTSVPAKTINPPERSGPPASTKLSSDSEPSDHAFADYAFEAIVTSTLTQPSQRRSDGSFGPESSVTPAKNDAKPNMQAAEASLFAMEAEETQALRPNTDAPMSSTFPTREPHFQSRARTNALERSTESVAKVAVPIQSLWEVDCFYWPTTVESLLESQPEAFHEIGLHFQHMQSKGLRVLSITSGERGVGRSTVAMCLAKAVAKTGLRVALVDGDYETPALIDQLNMAVDHGWQECIHGNVPLDEVVVQSLEDNVALVPLTDSIAGSIVNEQIARINKLIKRLSSAYDFVVIDGNRLTQKNPRLVGSGEEAVLDAALVIVDAELSLRQRVDTAIELIREQGIQSIGLAENFHSETSR